MRASFLPGDLHLTQAEDGSYVVSLQGAEILKTRSRKAAVDRFNELRREMEVRYPARDLTPEEKAEIFRAAVIEGMLGHNSSSTRKKSTSARGTRTFGG